jgi:hypothetical protein
MLWCGWNRVFGPTETLGFDIVFCNTVPYTVNQYLQMVNITVPYSSVALLFRIFTVVIILGALYLMYQQPENIARMLKLILVVIVVAIMFSTFRAPQYIVWFTPFAALLVADDLWGIVLFIGVQILGFIEYPLAYDVVYENHTYLSEWALVFFTVFFIMLGLLLWRALTMKRTDIQREEEGITGCKGQ